MADRAEKLDIPTSNPREPEPTRVTLNFDAPLEKEGNYGPYWIYNVKHKGEDRVIFASKALHKEIEGTGAKKGTEVSILKFGEKQDTRWDVVRADEDKTIPHSEDPFPPKGTTRYREMEKNEELERVPWPAEDNNADPAAEYEERKARYLYALEEAKEICEDRDLNYTVNVNAMAFTLLQIAKEAKFDPTKK